MTYQPELAKGGKSLAKVSVHSSSNSFTYQMNAVAFHQSNQNYLMVLSCAGPSASIRALRAMLTVKQGTILRCIDTPGIGEYVQIRPAKAKFKCHVTRISSHYNLHHMLAFADDPMLLKSDDDESLWQALRQPHVTTPIRRCWVNHISTQLRETGKLKALRRWGCTSALLEASVPDLDAIVTGGIQAGWIGFDEPDPEEPQEPETQEETEPDQPADEALAVA